MIDLSKRRIGWPTTSCVCLNRSYSTLAPAACSKCQTERSNQKHQRVQAKHDRPGGLGRLGALAVVHEVLRPAGKPLDPSNRVFMEQRFGYDFSRVRVLSGAAAEQSAQDFNIMTKGLSGQRCDSAPSGEEEEEGNVMRRATPGESHRVNGNVGNLLSRSRGGGRTLSDTVRTFMETRFGHDFGDVRIHTDSDAAQMTKALHAEAFATGRDIYFQPGKFAPHVSSGKRLLAHELTHVVQQRGNDFIGRSTGSSGAGQKYWIQRYSLRGFPPTEEAAMKAAIPVAASTVLGCLGPGPFSYLISDSIKNIRYDYVDDLGLSGWTFPSSWYIEIGKSAFDRNVCCNLPSTIAHEASHAAFWFTESGARKLECKCFGCSCSTRSGWVERSETRQWTADGYLRFGYRLYPSYNGYNGVDGKRYRQDDWPSPALGADSFYGHAASSRRTERLRSSARQCVRGQNQRRYRRSDYESATEMS
jgi:Domain of unknown function (DUF4157)